MVALPPINQLIDRCRALAALDLILSPDWQYRFYSFNANWSDAEMMASMRDGCGDEWWIVFNSDGWAALKGLSHESLAWRLHREKLSLALQHSLPVELNGFSTEPAFRWGDTSFAYFNTGGSRGWTCANDLTDYSAFDAGDVQLLAHLVTEPCDYAQFAADYYETSVDERLVAEVFALKPITAAIVSSLNPSTSLQEISEELYGEIKYPGANVA